MTDHPPPSHPYLIRLKTLGLSPESESAAEPHVIRIQDEVSYAKLVGSLHQRLNPSRDSSSPYATESRLPYYLRLPFFFHPWTVSPHICTVTRLLSIALCILGVIAMSFDTWVWMRWISCFLLVDTAVRVVAGNRGALISSIAECVTVYWPSAASQPSAPWQIANIIYTILSGITVILTFAVSPDQASTRAPNTIAAAALYGVQLLWLLSDLYEPVSLSNAVLALLIRLHIVDPASYMHTFTVVNEEQRMAAAELHLRKTESALKHTVLIRMAHQMPPATPAGAEQPAEVVATCEMADEEPSQQQQSDLPADNHRRARSTSFPHGPTYEYAAATDPFKRQDFHLIRNCPVAVFFPTLGLAGLVEAWYFASQPNTLNAPPIIWQILAVVAGVQCAC